MNSGDDMVNERIKFVRIIRNRHGTEYAFFRTRETGDVRLRGLPGSSAFHKHYGELLETRERILAQAVDEQSLTWLINQYLASVEFKALADSTQLDYCRTCELLKADDLGRQPFQYVSRAMVKAVRNEFASQPRKAHKIKQMVSCLYSWAAEAEHVAEGFNPVGGLKRLKRKGGDKEIVAWSDAEIGWFLEAAPAHVRLPVMLALYTGQRREDVCAMTWQQWQGDIIRLRQSKTGELLELPCHPALKAELETARRKGKIINLSGPICRTEAGLPYTVNGMSGAIRRQVEKIARMPNNRSMHGLRYAAAARMAEGGATIDAIEAVLGHRTYRMAMKYAGGRLRASQGIAAMRGAD